MISVLTCSCGTIFETKGRGRLKICPKCTMDRANERRKTWREKNLERCKRKANVYYLSIQEELRQENLKLKERIISEYGGVCVCCGEGQIEFLTVDHINNDGAKHRKNGGKKLYKWLERNEFPKDNFQILCMNCNWAKGRLGKCPHHRSKILKDPLALMASLDDMGIDYHIHGESPVQFIKGAIPTSLLRNEFLTVLSAVLMEA